MNVTNARFELLPVVWRLAIEHGLSLAPALTAGSTTTGGQGAEWLFLTANPGWLRRAGFQMPGTNETEQARAFPLWTDETLQPLAALK